MLENLKFKETPDSKIYFWGCTHIFHDPKWPVPLWRLRGYDSVKAHAESIRNKINNTCNENSSLFLMGDGFLNSSPEQVEEFLFSLKPQIHYLFGNHESSMIRLYRKYRDINYPELAHLDLEIYPLKYKNLTFHGYYLECTINYKKCILQHFPIQVFNYSKHGSFMLHSHNHGGLVTSLPSYSEGKILDCGVDVFPDGPISFYEIEEIMKGKSIKKLDMHH